MARNWSRNWYMREKDPQRRSLDGVPRLYQKYVGHDNNRDFYMATQAETININRVLYQRVVSADRLQPSSDRPAGTVMFAPPFRDPFNYVFDPLLPVSIDAVGAAMHTRFAAEGKPGVTMRSRVDLFDVVERRAADDRLLPQPDRPAHGDDRRPDADRHPVRRRAAEAIGRPAESRSRPQPWHFRQSVDYSMTANRAVLDFASRHREDLLFNIYRMGKNAIDRGSRDTWTPSPRVHARRGSAIRSFAIAARRYILPADQPDFPTAVQFVDALLKNGIRVHARNGAVHASGHAPTRRVRSW